MSQHSNRHVRHWTIDHLCRAFASSRPWTRQSPSVLCEATLAVLPDRRHLASRANPYGRGSDVSRPYSSEISRTPRNEARLNTLSHSRPRLRQPWSESPWEAPLVPSATETNLGSVGEWCESARGPDSGQHGKRQPGFWGFILSCLFTRGGGDGLTQLSEGMFDLVGPFSAFRSASAHDWNARRDKAVREGPRPRSARVLFPDHAGDYSGAQTNRPMPRQTYTGPLPTIGDTRAAVRPAAPSELRPAAYRRAPTAWSHSWHAGPRAARACPPSVSLSRARTCQGRHRRVRWSRNLFEEEKISRSPWACLLTATSKPRPAACHCGDCREPRLTRGCDRIRERIAACMVTQQQVVEFDFAEIVRLLGVL